MPRRLLFIVLVGMSLTACGSDTTPSSASPTAAPEQTDATDDVVTIPVAAGSDLIQRVCDGIGRTLGEMGAIPSAVAEMYGPELLVQLSSLVDMNALHNDFDEEAVKTTCPTEYADFLTKAKTTSLFGVSAP
jgi:hypothetical protein